MRTTRAKTPKMQPQRCPRGYAGSMLRARKDGVEWPSLPPRTGAVEAINVRMRRVAWRLARPVSKRNINPVTRALVGKARLSAMGRLGGLATAARRTPEQRSAAARYAALMRWSRHAIAAKTCPVP